ncbi:MAG: threo-3-hydroxy-L-aspartate ammonia-lyase, partial [Gammaproteobacteria bacterium]|nr:threo-3-hydroxy-L-aspartate ammonia-lyase [Gammaproteobacteria bacterium]
AETRLRGNSHLTPVMTSRTLDKITGASVFLKCENLQRVGAFKFRGAYNALSKLSFEQRSRGVISYSSGNHAQALACAGQQLGVAITVVMPENAPRIKREATVAYGATVIDYDPATESREAIGNKLATEQQLTLIPPYDHPDVIAGQGTAAFELIAECDELDCILVPTGGAGLLSSTALIATRHAPECQVIGVEPELADDATRSFKTGQLQTVHNPPTIADGVRTPSLGKWTFPIVRKHVADMLTVSEDEIKVAVRFLLQRMKLLVEPAGALGVAALLSGAIKSSGRVGVILSGGNIDEQTLCKILQDEN